ncbi:MAG: hypothetical protein LKF71_04745 [Oscillospiraceae bacterium]|jgi:hypothetical protein|nr:hypothetical protein [Oscillospiraceae bacterium]
MTIKRYENAEFVKLEDFIPVNRFRTVLPEMLSIPCGIGEIPVEVDVMQAFAVQLPQEISADGITIYGFVRPNDALKQRFGTALTENHKTCRITISDWENRFLFLCETGVQEIPAFVNSTEVQNLLTNCLHAHY